MLHHRLHLLPLAFLITLITYRCKSYFHKLLLLYYPHSHLHNPIQTHYPYPFQNFQTMLFWGCLFHLFLTGFLRLLFLHWYTLILQNYIGLVFVFCQNLLLYLLPNHILCHCLYILNLLLWGHSRLLCSRPALSYLCLLFVRCLPLRESWLWCWKKCYPHYWCCLLYQILLPYHLKRWYLPCCHHLFLY